MNLGREPIRAMMYMFFPGGGIGRYTDRMLSAMMRVDGMSVELACSPQFEYLESADYPTWPRLSSIASSNVVLRKAKFLRSQFTSPRLAMNRAYANKVDIVHFSNINHLSYATWRRRAINGSFSMVATAHDVRRASAILNRQWETKWLTQFYRDCSAVFVHSDNQKEDLLDFADAKADRIHVIPHGIYEYPAATGAREELRAKYNVPLDVPVGLFFGAIRDDKNLDSLLVAMTRAKVDQQFLVIAGRPINAAAGRALKERLSRLGLEDRVLLLDRFIQESEVGDLFVLSDYVALTYRTSFTSQSGVLNVAAHYRRPVLVSPAPTLFETVQRYGIGLGCEGDDADSIAEGLNGIMQLPELSDRFDNYRKKHDWNEIARATAGVYREILGR